jgi:ankyrin repeat protein/V8-like Glu-specific endopeptidase
MHSLVIALFVSIFTSSLCAQEHKAIFGDDSVFDFFELSNQRYNALSKTTVALVKRDQIVESNNGYKFKAKGQSLAQSINMCADERFSQQERQAFCTGFFITPDIVMTAGHCINQDSCNNTAFLMDFKTDPTTQQPNNSFDKNQVYFCQKVIAQKHTSFDNQYEDYALVMVDRKVDLNINYQEIHSLDSLTRDDELLIIGHPSGLSQKIAREGKAIELFSNNILATDIDSFGGNSGSPIFEEKTGKIIGILVAGGKDGGFETEPGRNCKSWVRCKETDNSPRCFPNMVQLVNRIPEVENGVVNSIRILELLENRKLAEAKKFLEQKYDPNTLYRNDYSFAQLAIWAKDLDLLKKFISEGNTLNHRDIWGRNAFNFAAAAGWIEGAEYLLSLGAAINSVNMYGETSLHIAARRGHTDFVKLLLKNGANPLILTKAKVSVLELAIANDKKEVISTLLQDARININAVMSNGETPLEFAYKAGHFGSLELLLQKDAQGNLKRDYEHLSSLAKKESLPLVKLLLKRGINIDSVDKNGSTFIDIAFKNEERELFDFAVKNDANLYLLFERHKSKMSIELLNKLQRFDYFKSEPYSLFQILPYGDTDLVLHGLNLVERFNIVDSHSDTAVFFLMRYEKGSYSFKRILKALIAKGVNVDERHFKMKTYPLHFAVKKNVPYMAEALLRACANADLEDSDGKTAYDIAKDRGLKKEYKDLFRDAKKLCAEGL